LKSYEFIPKCNWSLSIWESIWSSDSKQWFMQECMSEHTPLMLNQGDTWNILLYFLFFRLNIINWLLFSLLLSLLFIFLFLLFGELRELVRKEFGVFFYLFLLFRMLFNDIFNSIYEIFNSINHLFQRYNVSLDLIVNLINP
jgi:hypothetical protein